MAIAGRVAIVPKGEWSQSVTYDKLDLVTYNGNTFIAYKSSVGVEPVDGDTWMLVMQGIDPQEINNIIDGTTPVGNALKLGGKGASEYFTKDGGTLTDKLIIQKASPSLDLIGTDSNRTARIGVGSSGLFNILNMADTNNYGALYVRKETDSLDVALQVIRKVNGATTTYNVLHTGNVGSYALPITGGTIGNGK